MNSPSQQNFDNLSTEAKQLYRMISEAPSKLLLLRSDGTAVVVTKNGQKTLQQHNIQPQIYELAADNFVELNGSTWNINPHLVDVTF